jgi:hypothetical protein
MRRMMVAVAVVEIVIWGAQTVSRWHLYRKRAEHHATEHMRLRAELAPSLEFKREAGYFPGCGLAQMFLETECERAAWHACLMMKYQRASFRPWLQVEPNPPEPE